MVDNNFVETVIALAPNLFFGTSIAVNILVLSKHKTNNQIQFIDASKLFKKETNNNVLTDEHIEKILQIFAEKSEIAHQSANIDNNQIASNDYNLSVSSYVEAEDTREVIDIAVLNEEIRQTVSKISTLRQSIDDIIAQIEME
ncbi:Type I restriction-modification system methyltransferase subunit [Moraxella lacunata]|uniref:site-specific DNA-methyltransferase (adenine-specific) n=1 Tax=Moraxella lacunata TaxID=477 RepID=A0A378TTA7_MORLA|nr:Type I restriction-modification system methyltransferase subunit [Moraxella lacunata]